MYFNKNNLWIVFYLVAFFWLLSFCVALSSIYNNTFREVTIEQENLTSMTANSLTDSLHKYEVILNIFGELLENCLLTDKELSQARIYSFVNSDPSILAVGFFKPDGQLLLGYPLSASLVHKPLNHITETKRTFQYTLDSQEMVIGRTYFNDYLGELIIPVRKSVRNKQGEVIFVVSLAISLEKGFSYFINNIAKSQSHNTYLYREVDRYLQLAPIKKINDQSIYNYQIPVAEIDDAIIQLELTTDMSYDQIKASGKVITQEVKRSSQQLLSTNYYLKRYQLWLTTEISKDVIVNNFINKSLLLFFAHLFSIIVIFFLFRKVATGQKKQSDLLFFQASHDYLTNLHNRFYLDQQISNLPANTTYHLIYFDIDNFQKINNNFNYKIGDKLLIKTSRLLESFIAADDLLIRASSDKFVIVSFSKDRQQINDIAKKILNSFNNTFEIEQYKIKISVNISIASNDSGSGEMLTLEQVKRNSVLAMKVAKTHSEHLSFFEHELLAPYLERNEIELQLKTALTNNEIYMVYQPLFAKNEQLIGVEALIRWNNSKLGLVSPETFIAIAESTRDICSLGEFILQTSMQEIKQVIDCTKLELALSINISVCQFQQENFFEQLEHFIDITDFDRLQLKLEVTENVLIDDIENIRNLLLQIKRQGIKISLDDFGTGYSSLSLLKNLPLDELKIDKSFVMDMLSDPDSYAMVEAIIAIAKQRDLAIVAEGVETQEIAYALANLDCDVFQGYFYAKPLPKNELIDFITHKITIN